MRVVHTAIQFHARTAGICCNSKGYALYTLSAAGYISGLASSGQTPETRAQNPFAVALPAWSNDPGRGCKSIGVRGEAARSARLAHLEAGLRSHDWRMPEEVNRVLTDRCSALLLTPSRDAHANLAHEGIDPDRVVFVGNVMIDTLFAQLERARSLNYAADLGVRAPYAVATLHRPSNVDTEAALRVCLEALASINEEMPVILPLHPRTAKMATQFGFSRLLDQLSVTGPLGYREMLSLTSGASVVITDSGGLQEESTALGIPCVTLR